MKTKTFLLLTLWVSFFELGLAQQFRPQQTGLKPTNLKPDSNWEFVKDRLFDGETKKVLKYNSDIHIRLTGKALKADSTIVADLIEELKKVISTNKIELVKTGGNLVLNFNNKHEGEYISYKTRTGIGQNFDKLRVRGAKLKARSGKIENTEKYKHLYARFDTMENEYSSVNFNFNDSLDISERKKYIEYEIIHSLCVINSNGSAKSPYFVKGPILGKSYGNSDPLKTDFNDMDKFLLSKLYSADFQKQFKAYMIKKSSWHSYMIFANKAYMRSIGITSGIILVVIVLLLTYKPIFRRNFRHPYVDYIIRGIVISITVSLIQIIYHYFTSSSASNGVIIDFLNILMAVLLVSVLISTPLYFIEKLFIRPDSDRLVQSGLKMFFLLSLVTLLSLLWNTSKFDWSHTLFDFIAIGFILASARGVLMLLEYSEELKVLATASEISKLKELKTKAEIQSLQSRINPHFLYNSLNSIAGLAHSDPGKVEKMALSLSDLFRYSVNRTDDQMSTILDEINMVRSYLEIEQIRFGERLSYKIDMDKTIENMQIPKFILQPIVENAVKHGVSKQEGKGEIKITIEKNSNKIVITVFDNGPAFPEGFVSGAGLQSVYDLLNLICGGDAEVNWQNNPEKFIKITIPV